MWTAIVAGTFAIIGAIAGNLTSAWRDSLRWKRELAREDIRWERDQMKESSRIAHENASDLRDRRISSYSEHLATVKLYESELDGLANVRDLSEIEARLSTLSQVESQVRTYREKVELICGDDIRSYFHSDAFTIDWLLISPRKPHFIRNVGDAAATNKAIEEAVHHFRLSAGDGRRKIRRYYEKMSMMMREEVGVSPAVQTDR